jgi:plastocyanin
VRLALVFLLGLAAGAVPALAGSAKTHTVTVGAGGNTYKPTPLEVERGDTVAFQYGNGFHNVKFDDEPGTRDIPTQRTFDANGSFHYVCTLHPGMEGVVNVVQASTTTATTGTTTTGTTTTTTTTTTSTTGTTTTPTTTVAPEVASLEAAPTRSSFCVRRCARPGIAIRLTADAGVVRGVLRRIGAPRAFGRISFTVRDGTQVVRFSRVQGRRPPPGRYRLSLRHDGWPSSVPSESVRFRVR